MGERQSPWREQRAQEQNIKNTERLCSLRELNLVETLVAMVLRALSSFETVYQSGGNSLIYQAVLDYLNYRAKTPLLYTFAIQNGCRRRE